MGNNMDWVLGESVKPQMTKVEIIKQIFAGYIADPSTRAVDPFGCYFELNGNNCAIGKTLIDPIRKLCSPKVYIGSSFMVKEEVQKPEYHGHNQNNGVFWNDLRKLHNNSGFWTETGLSEEGQIEYDRLIEKYS